MQIDSRSWHCRVYQWWYFNKYHSFANNFSNLCPYVRAVILWAPLRALFGTWIKVWRVPLNALTLPLLIISFPWLLGYLSYTAKLFTLELYVLVLAVTIGSFVGLFAAKGLNEAYRPVKNSTIGLSIRKRTTTFRSLLTAYSRSAHDRVCPEVNWGRER